MREQEGRTLCLNLILIHIFMRLVNLFAHKNIRGSHEDQINWMNEFYERKTQNNFKALGFRTKLEHQVELDRFIDHVNATKIVTFILQRRNLVKKAISRINAIELYKQTKDYNIKKEEQQRFVYNIRPKRLFIEIDNCEAQREKMSDIGKMLNEPNYIYYEDLLIDEENFFDSIIVDQLNLTKRELKTSVFKNTSDDLSLSISNFHELKERLTNTPYYEDLVEVLSK